MDLGYDPDTASGATNTRAWMITFTDLVSLLLTFFVLLFSMSNVKLDEWQNVIDSLSRSLNPNPENVVTAPAATYNIGTIFRRRAINLDYLQSVLEKHLTQDPVLGASDVRRVDERLVISLPGARLFEPGTASLSEGAGDAMFGLGGLFRNIGNQIGVNAHTDPTPPAGDGYASNWELSTGRAAQVANALRRAGYDADIIAFGYADSRYAQLPDVAEDQRRVLGQRIDVVVFPTVGGR